MTRESLWVIIIERNPEFEQKGANLSAKGLRKFFDLAYSKGFEQGKSYAATQNRKPDNPFSDMFGGIFGK
jgi:hypothetical protein